MILPKRLWTSVQRFAAAECGNTTVEFTLWVPAFVGVLMLGADASTAFSRQSNLRNVMQETARFISRHALDAEEGEAFVRKRVGLGSYTPDVDIVIDETTQIVTVAVSVDPAEMAPFGLLALVMGDRISVSVSQALEPL
jgi:Flp pilus assembly protein TadG